MVDPMETQGPYLEHIDSKEIKKLIDRIYSSSPEDIIVEPANVQTDGGYQDIIQNIDQVVNNKTRDEHQSPNP
jgi:hypothetical protein